MRDAPHRQAKPQTAARSARAPAGNASQSKASQSKASQSKASQSKASPQHDAKFHAVAPSIAPKLTAAAAVLAGVGALMLFTGGRVQKLESAAGGAATRGLASVGFAVKSVEIEGGTNFSAPYILAAAGVSHGAPILGLDLNAVRDRVEKVGWVKSVRVLRLLPDTLVIAVAERPRLAVWQSGGQSHVVDPDGQIIPEADPGLFVDLPLIVGEGANEAASAILPQITMRPRLMSRIEALVRVDGRRWDLRLKDGSLIQLPAQDEDSALIQLDQLDQKDRLFDLGFQRIDLRDPDMIAVRPRQAPPTSAAAGAKPAVSPALPTTAPAAVTTAPSAPSTLAGE
jgi:cell division protein FtsQ